MNDIKGTHARVLASIDEMEAALTRLNAEISWWTNLHPRTSRIFYKLEKIKGHLRDLEAYVREPEDYHA
jgi:hypothetical protein